MPKHEVMREPMGSPESGNISPGGEVHLRNGENASGGGSALSVCVLASGSRGNATYVSDGTTAILVDAGLSGVEVERRLASRGLSAESLSAIVVTHEHTDHVQGAGVLSRRYGLPLHINRHTFAAAEKKLGVPNAVHHFENGRSFSIGELALHPFSIPHDAEDPVGFTVEIPGAAKIGIATDLGLATAVVRENLKGCRLLFLEANHDPVMLENGPYPWSLKQRVRGRCGHLSNQETAALLSEIRSDALSHVILGHLSADNNDPQKALSVVGEALDPTRTALSLATQDRAHTLIHLE